MQIDDKLISSLEELSYLKLSADEKNRFMGELQEILASAAGLPDLDTGGVNESSSPLDKKNVFREDEVLPSLDRELILRNAPNRNNEMFIAPKTVDQAGEKNACCSAK